MYIEYIVQGERSGEAIFRQMLENILVAKNYRMYLEINAGALALISSTLYIYTTYRDSTPLWYNWLDACVCFMFLLEYILRLYISQHKFQLFLTSWSLLNLFIISTVFFVLYFQAEEDYFGRLLLASSRLLRFIKLVQVFSKYFSIGDTDVTKQLISMSITMFTLIYVSSGLFRVIENSDRNHQENLSFHISVYFIVVTLSTVGYGDIYPISELGKVFVIFLIITALVVVPKQTNELVQLMGIYIYIYIYYIESQSMYARAIYKKKVEVPHVILTGEITVQSIDIYEIYIALTNYCQELFHPDHGSQDKQAIILQSSPPSLEMEMFLHSPAYELFLTYVQVYIYIYILYTI